MMVDINNAESMEAQVFIKTTMFLMEYITH